MDTAESSGALATITSSAIAAVSSIISDGPHTSVLGNGTSPYDLDPTAGADEGNYFLNTLIGFVIVVSASALNAFGLNVTKLDHTRQQSLPRRERKKEWMRPLWLAGMGMYIASQIFGSTLALRWLRPDWVAPLGSTSLIFNFIFASWLVGTPVTRTDINGTAVIVLGVILILVFSSINHGLSQHLSVDRLNSLWARIDWLAYFVFLSLFTFSVYFSSSILARLLASRASYSPLPDHTDELPIPSRPKAVHPVLGFFKRVWAAWKRWEAWVLARVEMLLQRAEDGRVTWLQGIGWAVAGGSLAGMCLVFTKSVVKLLGLPGHPFLNLASIITVICVAVTAILQIVCLNRALVCADTVVVVPLFYAGYTVFGFINSLIFYDEAGQYEKWVLVAVFASIAVLISGVTILSLKSSAKSAPDPYTRTITTEPSSSVRMRPQVGRRGTGNAPRDAGLSAEAGPSSPRGKAGPESPISGIDNEVMWEVGSVSDDGDGDREDDRGDGSGDGDGDGQGEGGGGGGGGKGDRGEPSRRGLGGGNVRGERRGLLLDDMDDGEFTDQVASPAPSPVDLTMTRSAVQVPVEAERNPFADDGHAGRQEEGDESFGDFETVNRASQESPRR